MCLKLKKKKKNYLKNSIYFVIVLYTISLNRIKALKKTYTEIYIGAWHILGLSKDSKLYKQL